MEESHSQEEPPRKGTTEDLAPLDEVDHRRLARLIAESPRPAQAALRAMPTASAQKSAAPVFLIAAAIITLIILGGAAYWLTRLKSSVAQDTSNPYPTPIVRLNQPPNPNIKREMVTIPGGTFEMGRDGGAPAESPPHPVTVATVYIDNTEVTNAEYAQFLKDNPSHAVPSHFVNGSPMSGQEQWPVVNVSLQDAKDFAAWRSKRDGVTYRLPTEEEWEFAARDGGQGSLFPWGSSWVDGKANVNTASLKPVGSSPDDKTKAGVMDMIGNAYEWTSSKASYYPGSKLQVRDENKDWIIVRGGAYVTELSKKQISAAYRDWIPPTTTNPALGFRLVRDAVK